VSNSRRTIGILIAIAVLAGVVGYGAWRVNVMAHSGWAGFSYIPSLGPTGPSGGTAAIQPGAVFMLYPGAPADRAGIERGDVVLAINGISARDFDRLSLLANGMRSGDLLRYRLSRAGRPRDIALRLESPLRSPVFAASFLTSIAVAVTFLLIGTFVFWRRPADARAVVFFAMTVVAAVTFVNTSLLQVDSSQMRGISANQSSRDIWRFVSVGASGLFFAPLLLHLALVFPKRRPVLERRPKVLRWVYAYPTAFVVYGLVLLAALTALEQRGTSATKAIFATAAAGAVVGLCVVIASIVRRGIREGVLNAPIAVVTVVVSSYAGGLFAAGRMMARSKSVVPLFAATLILVIAGIATFGAYAVATFVAMFRSYRESGAEERQQVKWPIWAMMVAMGSKILLAIAGFAIVFGTFNRGPMVSLLYGAPDIIGKLIYILIPIAFAFAILKYRLMNIDVIIRRTVLYSILTFVIFALYAVVVAAVGTALVKFAGLTNSTVLVASTVIVAIAAVPIRNSLQRMVDRNLFREKRDYPLALRNIGNAIGGVAGDEFLRGSAEQVQQALQNRSVIIALRRDAEFVVTAKVGVADEVLGRVRVPVSDASPVPEPLRKLGATLVVPVRTARGVLALIAFGSKLSDEDFNADDLEFISSAASQIAIGIENARLRIEEVEFEQARAMQQILLPTRFPQLDGIEISGMWHPARSVGGDYFDTLDLGAAKAGICIGDVAGKGMPAALLMANLQAAVKATASATTEPAVVCERVKQIVGGNLVGGKFISFFYGVVDAASRTFAYSNAGHNPPIVVRSDSSVDRLVRGGPAMCRLFRDVRQEQDVMPIAPGDRIVLFTDGATEARRGEEDFGDDRLIQLLIAHRHLGARELQERIMAELRDFSGGDFGDDVTLVVVAAQ